MEALTSLLNQDLVPIIPLRGSISASGDLTPLSCIAGALEGNRDIYLDRRLPNGDREVMNAAEALQTARIARSEMQQKEALGLMNGTAVSCAAAALVLHETNQLLLAVQVFTAMCTEALGRSEGSFHPFIHAVCPHAGQQEVATKIRVALQNSNLIIREGTCSTRLCQDRYGLRTSAQCIGPQTEDVILAMKHVKLELNSTTDNPLNDTKARKIHHGGNFQACSVTSAMEKPRLALQMMGRLIFAQCPELINPTMSDHLSPNICFDDPDMSFSFKGVDINMAAYTSELGFLANPVSSHVQSAEMHNQSINSLALISARKTLDAAEIVSLMTATYLYTVCQALDLHVLHLEYTASIEEKATTLFYDIFRSILPHLLFQRSWEETWRAIRAGLVATKSRSLPMRAIETTEASKIAIMNIILQVPSAKQGHIVQAVQDWEAGLSSLGQVPSMRREPDFLQTRVLTRCAILVMALRRCIATFVTISASHCIKA